MFELWCCRRLLRVPLIARRSNQSILKEISSGYSLEGLTLRQKLQYLETHTGFGIATGVTLQGTSEARLQQAPLGLILCFGSISSKSCDQPRQHIIKQTHYLANKGLSSQGYGFSSGHVWMWELDCEEGWALKNWCFWTVVLEKTSWESLRLQRDPTSPS